MLGSNEAKVRVYLRSLQVTPERAEKIAAKMIATILEFQLPSTRPVSVAWAHKIVYASHGSAAGFLVLGGYWETK